MFQNGIIISYGYLSNCTIFVMEEDMLLKRKMATLELPARFVLKRAIPLSRKLCIRVERPARIASEKIAYVPVKVVDVYVSDKVLLFFLNALDKHVPPKAIDLVIDEVDKYVPPKVLSSIIVAADEYFPDVVASSRKISTVVAGVGKYVPDRIIPPESIDNWSNLKLKFHIPTLLSRRQRES